ncbi:MAG: type III-B CRISPR module-associated Cmr3 family protein [Limisphaerales bacterium]
MKPYTLTPLDVLFFRDGRPIETGGGHGARWPEPSVIFDALHAALWRAFPDKQAWEHRHDFGRSSHRPRNGDTQRFGSLKTAGIFPILPDDRWLFPVPQDVVSTTDNDTNWLLCLQPVNGSHTNFPAQWINYAPASHATPTKEEPAPWWTRDAWQAYLAGQRPAVSGCFANEELFDAEWTTGIGIDAETQTQDGERIYSAQYLRLREGVSAGFVASLPMKQNGRSEDVKECIESLLPDNCTIIVGGQQRTCQVRSATLPLAQTLPVASSVKGTRIKWVLLTPAIFPRIKEDAKKAIPAHPGGWLPNWVDPATGRVKLKLRAGDVRRRWNEAKQRTVREANEETDIAASLVAARIPKAIPVVGWTERLHLLADEKSRWIRTEGENAHGPRPTHLAVPAGAVYYFEADSDVEASNLAAALNWHGCEPNPTTIKNRRSTLLGEKGFGLGVCGTWDFYQNVAGRSKA